MDKIYSKWDLEGKTISELQLILQRRRSIISGKKSVLIERILFNQNSNNSNQLYSWFYDRARKYKFEITIETDSFVVKLLVMLIFINLVLIAINKFY